MDNFVGGSSPKSSVLVLVYAYMFCFKGRMSISKGANEEWVAGVTVSIPAN